MTFNAIREQPPAKASPQLQGTPSLQVVLRPLVFVLTTLLIALFCYSALRRMRYPYDLEWIESGILVSVARVRHGLPLYSAPSLNYIPYLYAPLYFYLCAGVARFTGISFFTLRLVSTGSALATLALLFHFVRRETRDTLAATVAIGLYAAMYPVSGGWFDIGRVDSLFLFLFLLALYCTRYAPPLLAALVWVLAFQTKQSVLPLAVPFLLTYWNRRQPSRVAVALVGYAAMAFGSIAWLNHSTHGWYSFYVFGAVAGLPGVPKLLALYVPEVLLAPLSTAFAIIAAAVLLAPVAWRTRRNLFYLLGSALLFPAFWYVHWHRGVGNTMLAVYLWTAVLFGLAVARLLRLAAAWDAAALPNARRVIAGWEFAPASTLVLLAVLAQLGAGIYSPGQYIPSAATRGALDAFAEQIRTIPGDVYVLNHSFDDLAVGKQPFAEGEAIGAVVDAGGQRGERLIGDLREGFVGHRWSAVAIDDDPPRYPKWFTPEDLAAYPVEIPAAGSELPRFLTSQPHTLLLTCDALQSGLAARLSLGGIAPVVPACAANGKDRQR